MVLVALVLLLNLVLLVLLFVCMVWPLAVLFLHKIARWWRRRRGGSGPSLLHVQQ
jgi:hypothetical protein